MNEAYPSQQTNDRGWSGRSPESYVEHESSVIVPLDGNETSLSALPVARELAKLADATLHIAHVDLAHVPDPERLLSLLHLDREDISGLVLDPRKGAPAEQIVELARTTRSSFIVLCKSAGAEIPGKGLGSTAEGVLAQAPCPVLFVPPERGLQPWHFHSALAPHDGTPTTSEAIPPMVRLLRKAQASLWVLYVAKSDGAVHEAGSLGVPRYVDQPQHEWPEWTIEFLERFHLQGLPGVRFEVAAGDPGEEIVRAARAHAVDLIVLGWRGTLESKRAMILKKILIEAPCPTLVFRVR